MKNYYALVILMLLPILLCGQDAIYRSDQTITYSHILDWDESVIEYVPWNTIDSNRHFLSTEFVDRIHFQNGRIEVFKKIDSPENIKQVNNSRNYLGIGLLDPIAYGNLRFLYERRFGLGAFSLSVPLTIGIKERSNDIDYYYDSSERDLNFRIGLGINFHVPRKRGNSIYVVGLGIYGGKIDEQEYENFEPYNYYYESRPFFTFSNSHSLRLHLSDWLIIAPGVDFNIIGTSWKGYRAFFEPYFSGFKIDFLFNLTPKS